MPPGPPGRDAWVQFTLIFSLVFLVLAPSCALLGLVLLMLRISPGRWRRASAPMLLLALLAPSLFALAAVLWRAAVLAPLSVWPTHSPWLPATIAAVCGLLWAVSLGVVLRSLAIGAACAGLTLLCVAGALLSPLVAIVAPLVWVAANGVLVLMRLADSEDRTGECPACGYDLIGVAAHACPECGEAIPEPTRWAARRRELNR